MELKSLNCPFCGAGGLEKHAGDESLWHCVHCGADFTAHSAQREYEKLEVTIKAGLGSVIDEALLREKTEKYYNLRSLLWGKITATYIDSKAIVSICRDILAIAQHDFLAEFFEVANSANPAEIAEYIQNMEEEENALLVEVVLDFIIKSLKEEYITPTAALLERCGNRIFSPEKKQAYLTKFEAEAAKVQSGIYELGIERDVFLAYSSKDMPKVLELLHLIESNGLSCFAAFRNLQHGRDAVANYDKALAEAIDHCSIFLFVSSVNSRSFSCDAFKKEIAYVRNSEMHQHPEYRSYTQIPEKFKKLRIEYRLDNKPTPLVDKNLKEFFSGLTYVEDQEQLFARLGECMEKLSNPYAVEEAAERKTEDVISTQKAEEIPKKEEESAIKTEPKAENLAGRHIKDELKIISADFQIQKGVLKKYLGKGGDVAVPDGVTYIDKSAFSSCGQVRSITLPNSVTSIGSHAFERCTGLTSIIIPDSVERIGDGAFGECSNLINVTIPKNMDCISEWMFSNCSSLENIDIPKGVRSIGGAAFARCSSLRSITISDGITGIDSAAFKGCVALKGITLPDSVTSIGFEAFCGCFNLRTINIPKSVIDIGTRAFSDCKRLSIFVEGNTDKIRWRAGWNCDRTVYKAGSKKVLIRGGWLGKIFRRSIEKM